MLRYRFCAANNVVFFLLVTRTWTSIGHECWKSTNDFQFPASQYILTIYRLLSLFRKNRKKTNWRQRIKSFAIVVSQFFLQKKEWATFSAANLLSWNVFSTWLGHLRLWPCRYWCRLWNERFYNACEYACLRSTLAQWYLYQKYDGDSINTKTLNLTARKHTPETTFGCYVHNFEINPSKTQRCRAMSSDLFVTTPNGTDAHKNLLYSFVVIGVNLIQCQNGLKSKNLF